MVVDAGNRRTGVAAPEGSARDVFRVFLGLGLTSFGGPVAHLAYFRTALVERRRWLSDAAYADIVALCQVLPGPASSQVGMAIGLRRAGFAGMLAAWVGFTLPSALLMIAFAYGATAVGDAAGSGWIHGIKAAAVAVVAQALIGMARTLSPDRERATIAVAAMVVAMLSPTAVGQMAAIALGAVAGLVWLTRDGSPAHVAPEAGRVGRAAGIACLTLFGLLLAGLPLVAAATADPTVATVDSFYRAGSLVFGGGHVVLPLLQAETVQTGLVSRDSLLAGYGAAVALVAIFLPSALLVAGAMPFWSRLGASATARRTLAGINAAVVGLLAAAFYDPVFADGIGSPPAMAVAAASFVAMTQWRVPPWAVVAAAAVAGYLIL